MVSDSSIRVFRFDAMNLLTPLALLSFTAKYAHSDFTMVNLIFTKRMDVSFWSASNSCWGLDVNDRSNEA